MKTTKRSCSDCGRESMSVLYRLFYRLRLCSSCWRSRNEVAGQETPAVTPAPVTRVLASMTRDQFRKELCEARRLMCSRQVMIDEATRDGLRKGITKLLLDASEEDRISAQALLTEFTMREAYVLAYPDKA